MTADQLKFHISTGVCITLRDDHKFDVINIEAMPEAIQSLITDEERLAEIACAIWNENNTVGSETPDLQPSDFYFHQGDDIDTCQERLLEAFRNFFSRRKREILSVLLEKFDLALKSMTDEPTAPPEKVAF